MSDGSFAEVYWIDPVLGEVRESLRKQADMLSRLSDSMDRRFSLAVQLLLDVSGHVIVTGLGKSGLIGRKIASTLASTGTPSFFLHGTEALHGDLGSVTSEDAAIVISHSGETPEVLALVEALRARRVLVVALTGRPESTVGRQADVVLHVDVERELDPINLAPTNSSLATLALGDALAVALMRARAFSEEQFHQLHPGGSLGTRLQKVEDRCVPAPVLSPRETLQDALLAMAGSTVPVALVVDGATLVGILYHADLALALETHGPSAPCERVAQREAPVFAACQRAREVSSELRPGQAAAVVKNGSFIGVLLAKESAARWGKT